MNDNYLFHQTPKELAKDILLHYDYLFNDNDVLYEPFKGEGAFYDNFPIRTLNKWSEIKLGKDYKEEIDYDWVISNPPFRLEGQDGKRNAIWELIDYFTDKAKKGVIFLVNDYGLRILTTNRLEKLKNKKWGITSLTNVSVKKWRGRYYVIVFEFNKPSIINHFIKNY